MLVDFNVQLANVIYAQFKANSANVTEVLIL